MNSPLLEYIDRIEIIHLRERTDRYRELREELSRVSIDITHPKVCIPDAPMFSDAQGFPSKGVLGSYVSHLNAIKRAAEDGIEVLCVLEDDAIFRRSFATLSMQQQLRNHLQTNSWNLAFLGHPLSHELSNSAKGLIATSIGFKWAHCYLVHQSIMRRLTDYLEAVMNRPVGDPQGGKMYIDGAFSLFRRLYPDVVTLVSNPAMSIQRGSPSSLAGGRFYDRTAAGRLAIKPLRATRDWVWRITGWPAPGAH